MLDVTPFTTPALVATLIGAGAGFIVQAVSARLRYDKEWDGFTRGRRWAIDATGTIAALFVGLVIIDRYEVVSVPFLWAWQIAAAWSGATVLDAAARLVDAMVRRLGNGRRPPNGEG